MKLRLLLAASLLATGAQADDNNQSTNSTELPELQQHLKTLGEWVKSGCSLDETPDFLNTAEFNAVALEDAYAQNATVVFSGPWAEAVAREEAKTEEKAELAKKFGQTIPLKDLVNDMVVKPVQALRKKHTALVWDTTQNALVIGHKLYEAYKEYKAIQVPRDANARIYHLGFIVRPLLDLLIKNKIKSLPSLPQTKIVQKYALEFVYKKFMGEYAKATPFEGSDSINGLVDLAFDTRDLVKDYVSGKTELEEKITATEDRFISSQKIIHEIILLEHKIKNYSTLYAAVKAQEAAQLELPETATEKSEASNE